jgi:hypothetical protein
METLHTFVEPMFQGASLLSLGKDENPESKLAENDRIHRDVPLMRSQPSQDKGIGHWLGWFT